MSPSCPFVFTFNSVDSGSFALNFSACQFCICISLSGWFPTYFTTHTSYCHKSETDEIVKCRGAKHKMYRDPPQRLTGGGRTDVSADGFLFHFHQRLSSCLGRHENTLFALFICSCFGVSAFFFLLCGQRTHFIQSSNLKWSTAFMFTSWKFPSKVYLFAFFFTRLCTCVLHWDFPSLYVTHGPAGVHFLLVCLWPLGTVIIFSFIRLVWVEGNNWKGTSCLLERKK